MSWDGWMSNTSYLSGGGSSGSLWDSITDSASSIFGGIGSVANTLGGWAKDNEAGALIIGSTIGAAGQYITQKQADKAAAKREREQFKRYDQLHEVEPLNFDVTTDAGTLNGNAPVTSGGLLAQMQQNPTDYTKKTTGV